MLTAKHKAAIIASAGAALVILSGLMSFYTINEGERGVILRYGKIVKIAEPGLGFKLPVIDDVSKISIRSQASVYRGISPYSRDQQPA